jgi:hypothetical protein
MKTVKFTETGCIVVGDVRLAGRFEVMETEG